MKIVRARTVVPACLLVIASVWGLSKRVVAVAVKGSTPLDISVSSSAPSELNPQNGGAPKATVDQAADFAWQEFIALNWPAGPQNGQPMQRDTPSSTCHFGDRCGTGPLVWETFRGKVEIFPGNASPFKYQPPPGYPGPKGDSSLGYDALPVYNYSTTIPACDPSQASDTVPWVNLDETDQITLDNMYAGVVEANSSPGNSSPQLIRFLAKANRSQYIYVAANSSSSNPSNQWWVTIPDDVVKQTKAYLAKYQASPPANSSKYVSLPNGTIEVKAAWRPLNPSESRSGRFHIQVVRFYEQGTNNSKCYRDASWGLVALHIIQKTPSAPYFIYATFEQADNILTADGKAVEDAVGNIVRAPQPSMATTPQVCLVDPQPPVTPPPAYTSKPPYTAQNPAPSNFYQANIVVETNRSLQLFSGGLSPNISTDWNQDGSQHKNSYYAGHFYNMGGCMGCHGSQGQNPKGMAGDFSVILARGTVSQPESPALETSRGLTLVKRNRALSK